MKKPCSEMFCLRNQDITDAKAFFYLFFMSNSGYVIFEMVVSSISRTTDTYLLDIHNRIAAMFLLTSKHITEDYQTKQYYDLCIALEKYLIANFNCSLNLDLLESIASSGKIN